MLASFACQPASEGGDLQASAFVQERGSAGNRPGDGRAAERSISADCNNDGLLDLADVSLFTSFLEGPLAGSAGGCHCFDVDGSTSVDLRDFAAMQLAFGASPASSDPAPNNLFVLQLADYHAGCAADDGGDGVCHIQEPCCLDAAGSPDTPCTNLRLSWRLSCDNNGDGRRDWMANLDTLAEWNDFFWEPDDTCNLLSREQYAQEQTDKPFDRHFIPMCVDGTTPPKGTTVCPDGQPIIQCTDGSRPVFYYYPGTTDRWIIKIQGGGITCSAGSPNGGGDCWLDAERADFSSAWRENPVTAGFQGLFNADNGDFAIYSRVVIDKCVGDRNIGSNTIPVQDFFADDGTPKGQGPVYFHGFRETQALLAHLRSWGEGNQLTTDSQIAITAQSNGSNGLYMYLDRLADFIRHDPSDGQPGLGLAGADVRGLASAFVRSSVEAENLVNNPAQDIFTWKAFDPLSFDDHITAPSSTTGPLAADGLWYSSLVYYSGIEAGYMRDWGAIAYNTDNPTGPQDITSAVTIDESCFAAHGLYGGGGANVEACLDSMHVLMNHLTTPVFLAPQLYDFKLRDTALNSYTRMTDSFFDLGYQPDPGSVCGSHDENFACAEQATCPEGINACDMARTKSAQYDPADFAVRVRAVARGAVDRSAGVPEETPADVAAPVGHAVFAMEWDTHSGWADQEKMDFRICDDLVSGACAWRSAPLTVALRSWLELDATVICVERDDPGVDPDRPLTGWSETTPGPFLDDRCGLPAR